MVVVSEFFEGSSSSSSTHDQRYDVFLSFRGLDTRHSFTAYLHKALIDANIATFLDDEQIEIGEDLKPELESAIKASRASIIILSKNYAFSTWCLDELVMILDQRLTSNHIVVPVFYHVEPTHVKKQQSSFGDALAKHRLMMEAETNADKRSKWAQKMSRWKKALIEVGGLKGKDISGRQVTEFTEEIVKDIYRRLHISSRSPMPQLIGMDYSIKFVSSWLKDASSHTTSVLTILGMGGIGKTSLAKYVYGLHSHKFETSCFIKDISPRCEKFNGLLDLQKQLYDEISKPSPIQVHDASIYTSLIENVVVLKTMFLVLDDIDSLSQLDALLGSKGFHPESKIIITTKDAWLTESCALFKKNIKPKHAQHLLRGLDQIASRKLFCFHAFMCNTPNVGYEEVSTKLVNYCEGHPMALEVLGRSLYNRDVSYWEGYIDRLKKENDSPINNVLRMSFDSLPSKHNKDLFKHIACFFVGMDRDVIVTILEACDIETRTGITNLIDRCLLIIGWNNELMMHQLVKEMGRFVVRQESPDKPWERSRLWCQESFNVLKRKKGTENVLGLTLDMRILKKEKLHGSCEVKTDALSKMDSLMLLQLNYVHISGSYKNFPEELRWLCMHGFPLKSIPSDLPMENLVSLDMSCSNIESFDTCISNLRLKKRKKQLDGSCFKDKRLLGSLKTLNLSFCEQLRSVGGFDQLPALERLILTNCTGLLEVCESIEQCVELFYIDLSYCSKLEIFPRNISMLKKVKKLLLEGCNLGESRTQTRDMDSPKVNNVDINTKTSSFVVPEAIPSYLKFFTISFPSSLVSLSLANNNLSIKSFPKDFSCLFMLKELYLDENPIVYMPSCVRSLPRLEILSMQGCKMLKLVEHPPPTLRELVLYSDYKPLLRKVLFDQKMSPLMFSIGKMLAPSSFEFEGLVKIQPLSSVEEKILRSLGWMKLDFPKARRVQTVVWFREPEESEIQMYYEFGIFSTICGGELIPDWITDRSDGPSISFTIPSSCKKLRGLNFCCVRTPVQHVYEYVNDWFAYSVLNLPVIIMSNITKNHTWIYQHYIDKVNVGRRYFTLLSHWVFGMNEMEGGDEVHITVMEKPLHIVNQVTKECGVRVVYDDGDIDEEEDALGYYKSWNHIIGGDLTGFQLTTGEYLLSMERFMARDDEVPPWHRHLVRDGARFIDKQVNLRAFSQRKSCVPDGF